MSTNNNISARRGLFLCLIAILVLSFILEISFRVYDVLTGRILTSSLVTQLYTSSSQYHPFLQYTSKRNFHGFLRFINGGKKFEVHTNSHGFRTHEFYPKAPGSYRIILLGDSFIYGQNVNQQETVASVMERFFKKQMHKDIEVLSMGVSSYSGVRYAALARIYFDYLKPDMVIVSVDQSDFGEDLKRINHYILDEDGAPNILKNATTMLESSKQYRFTIDKEGNLNTVWNLSDWLLRIRMGSSLFNESYSFMQFVRANMIKWKKKLLINNLNSANIVRYEDLINKNGYNLASVLPKRMLADTIPFDLSTAQEKYQPTLKSLRYIKKQCDQNNIVMYLASYPYPWMVSIKESLHYQFDAFKAIYDFRQNRVHPLLLDKYASEIGVKHLNSYPAFETDTEKKFGDYDPHFNAYGYALYAKFLYESIKKDILTKPHNN